MRQGERFQSLFSSWHDLRQVLVLRFGLVLLRVLPGVPVVLPVAIGSQAFCLSTASQKKDKRRISIAGPDDGGVGHYAPLDVVQRRRVKRLVSP